ncbi:hypothetical protein [[Clostridium] aminophilum]|uniref:hypothetical protein n=1 Tax=[Clostridium] aminophilum TaxID=1526 RepID=UPI0033347116
MRRKTNHRLFHFGAALLLAGMLCLQGCAGPSFLSGSSSADSSGEETVSTEAEDRYPSESLLKFRIGKDVIDIGDMPRQAEVNKSIKAACGRELAYLDRDGSKIKPYGWAYTGFKIGKRYDTEFTLFNFLNDTSRTVSGDKTRLTLAAIAYKDDKQYKFGDQITYDFLPRNATPADADAIIDRVKAEGGVLTYYTYAYDPKKSKEPTSRYPMATKPIDGTKGLISLQFKTLSEQGQMYLIKFTLYDQELPDVAIINMDAETVARTGEAWPTHTLKELREKEIH